jgi:3' terminal RNA ribose 2'-O-methyltransferase Hen1
MAGRSREPSERIVAGRAGGREVELKDSMLLEISTTHTPATDLGYLLHKNPGGHHTAEAGFGTLHVLYPEASESRCTVALLVEVDPIGLVRDRRGPAGNDFSLAQYVNDRPYAASSFLSVALAKMFGTAMSGRSKERPALAESPIALEARLPVVPCRGGEPVLRRLFEPLGYEVTVEPIPLDGRFPAWGDSRYLDVVLAGTLKLKDLLEHLFVLLPVLDDDKHYWVGRDEVDKLLRRGGDWLTAHPDRELITMRYLRHDRALTKEALTRLLEDDPTDPDELAESHDAEEEAVERPLSLSERRIDAVMGAIRESGASSVVDLGCGSGKLLQRLLKEPGLERVVGMDVSHRALEVGARRLHFETMTARQRARVDLLQGSLTYRDRRLEGFDAAAVVEVIEHLDPSRLASFERVVFAQARPPTVVMTTPNVEYNTRFDTLPAGQFRHRDHRFEWSRSEFEAWSQAAATAHGYRVALSGIGDEDPDVGCPTQMAVFSR